MIKKLLLVGLGISIIVVKKSASFLQEKKEALERTAKEPVVEENLAEAVVEENSETPAVEKRTATAAREPATITGDADELTQITGIGPTYAKRLHEAGVSTFAALAALPADEVRAITKASGKSADVDSWIEQANALS